MAFSVDRLRRRRVKNRYKIRWSRRIRESEAERRRFGDRSDDGVLDRCGCQWDQREIAVIDSLTSAVVFSPIYTY